MKKTFLFFVSIVLFTNSKAQTEASQQDINKKIDSIKMAAMDEYAKKYPALRQIFFAKDIAASGTVKAFLKGKELFEGKEAVTRIRLNINVPVIQWGKNTITGAINYQEQNYLVKHIQNPVAPFDGNDIDLTKRAFSLTGIYNRMDTVFNLPVTYGGGITAISDNLLSIKRVNYLGSVSFPVKRSQYNSLTVGLLVIIDPSAPFPVFPMISYWHKYKNSDLELFLDLPSRVMLRKTFSKKLWATAGSELGGTLAFFNNKVFNLPDIPGKSLYRSIDIRTGINLEYLLTKKVVLGLSGGILSTASSRMFGKSDKTSDYFFNTSNASVPYVSFSLSFLPFIKGIK